MAFGITTLSHKFAPQHYITTLHQNIAPNNFTSKLCTTQLYSKTPKPIAHVPHFQYGKTLVFFPLHTIAMYCSSLHCWPLSCSAIFCTWQCLALHWFAARSAVEQRCVVSITWVTSTAGANFGVFPESPELELLGPRNLYHAIPATLTTGPRFRLFWGCLPPSTARVNQLTFHWCDNPNQRKPNLQNEGGMSKTEARVKE